MMRAFATEIARAVVAELRAGDAPGLIDQTASPLGRRRHIAAVRARVARGDSSAAIVGRRCLLAREALDAELATLARKAPRNARKAPPTSTRPDELADLRDRYGLERSTNTRRTGT
jgi:hypothetical protein